MHWILIYLTDTKMILYVTLVTGLDNSHFINSNRMAFSHNVEQQRLPGWLLFYNISTIPFVVHQLRGRCDLTHLWHPPPFFFNISSFWEFHYRAVVGPLSVFWACAVAHAEVTDWRWRQFRLYWEPCSVLIRPWCGALSRHHSRCSPAFLVVQPGENMVFLQRRVSCLTQWPVCSEDAFVSFLSAYTNVLTWTGPSSLSNLVAVPFSIPFTQRIFQNKNFQVAEIFAMIQLPAPCHACQWLTQVSLCKHDPRGF